MTYALTRIYLPRHVTTSEIETKLRYVNSSPLARPLASKQRRILSVLDQATGPSELDNPAWRLHPLRGNLVGYWSIRVTGNMRLVFRFDREEVVDVDLVDYH